MISDRFILFGSISKTGDILLLKFMFNYLLGIL